LTKGPHHANTAGHGGWADGGTAKDTSAARFSIIPVAQQFFLPLPIQWKVSKGAFSEPVFENAHGGTGVFFVVFVCEIAIKKKKGSASSWFISSFQREGERGRGKNEMNRCDGGKEKKVSRRETTPRQNDRIFLALTVPGRPLDRWIGRPAQAVVK